MQPKYLLNDTVHRVTPLRRNDDITLEIDDQQVNARIRWLDRNQCQLTVDGVVYNAFAAQDDNQLYIHLAGQTWQLEVQDELNAAGDSGSGAGGNALAPMPGVVIEISVETGQQVTEGQTLMLIESMKLQMEIKAPVSGVIKQLGVDGPGASFEKGSLLAQIEVAEGASE